MSEEGHIVSESNRKTVGQKYRRQIKWLTTQRKFKSN